MSTDVNSIEELLLSDPAGAYSRMDSATRERYRSTVEHLARCSRENGLNVARAAIERAVEFGDKSAKSTDRRAHVGYWLIGKGRVQFAEQLGVRAPWRWVAKDRYPNLLLATYAGTVTLGAFAIAMSLLALLPGSTPGWLSAVCLIMLGLAASHVSMSLCSQIVGKVFSPERMSRLDFSAGIPDEFTTFLVVPCLLVSPEGIEGLVQKLEKLYLANRDDNLVFCLATDFCDAESETAPTDDLHLDVLERGVRSLNEKYGARFTALHRPRKWNASDQLWMGWERKRGKLEELNAFLMGERQGVFSVCIGDPSLLRRPRFVLTLDDDMELPHDGAQRLASVLAHPLNLPLSDSVSGVILDGYGVLQPSMYVPLDNELSTSYVRLYSSGTNSVTNEVKPDLYQDLLGQGTFNGKGIYDLETFHRRLGGQMPENYILSHDMLEGSYVSSALVTDIQVPEEFPSTYVSNMARRHRWWRGDWQNIRWLLPNISLAPGSRVRNPISAVGYWRVIDNARRVVFPGAMLASILLGWFLSDSPTLWTILVIGGIWFVPILTSILLSALQKRRTEQLVFGSAITRWNWVVINFLNLAFLVYEARLATGALLVSSYRMLVSGRRLLEWTPSSVVNLKPSPSLRECYQAMWVCPVAAATIAALLVLWRDGSLSAATPILLLWGFSPCIAHRISRVPKGAITSQELDRQETF
jgi:hypothetical protein